MNVPTPQAWPRYWLGALSRTERSLPWVLLTYLLPSQASHSSPQALEPVWTFHSEPWPDLNLLAEHRPNVYTSKNLQLFPCISQRPARSPLTRALPLQG